MFFPPNNTPLLQPLDQNVIKSLKQRYRKHLLACLAALGAEDGIVSALKNINLKDVVYLVVQAWNEISVSVIQNSFKHLFSFLYSFFPYKQLFPIRNFFIEIGSSELLI